MKKLTIDSLAGDAVQLQMIYAGKGSAGQPGWVHEKTVAFAIIAEAVRGNYELQCPGKRIVTRRNEAWVAPANIPLKITHHPDPRTGLPTQFRFLHFMFTFAGGTDVTRLFNMPMKLSGQNCTEVGGIIEGFLRNDSQVNSRNLTWLARRQELAFKVLRILCDAAKPAADMDRIISRAQRLKPLSDYLHSNMARPITAADMAEICHMSLSGFHRYFKVYMGDSPINHLKRIRLNHAARLLLTTDRTISEIAFQTGFANPFHFSREFKHQFKQSPSEYRDTAY